MERITTKNSTSHQYAVTDFHTFLESTNYRKRGKKKTDRKSFNGKSVIFSWEVGRVKDSNIKKNK